MDITTITRIGGGVQISAKVKLVTDQGIAEYMLLVENEDSNNGYHQTMLEAVEKLLDELKNRFFKDLKVAIGKGELLTDKGEAVLISEGWRIV